MDEQACGQSTRAIAGTRRHRRFAWLSSPVDRARADVGGPLSRTSIVAREYGIPAVLEARVATERTRAGQTITLDGDGGVVTLPG